MKTLVIFVTLLVSVQASASCQEFLNDIKPYQLAYSRASTIFQQQAALTSIEIIQKQYPGEACKFKLDVYDGQVRAERIQATQEKEHEETKAERKAEESERTWKLEIYKTCKVGISLNSQETVESCDAVYRNKRITTANYEYLMSTRQRIREQEKNYPERAAKSDIYNICITGLNPSSDQEAIEKCNAAYSDR